MAESKTCELGTTGGRGTTKLFITLKPCTISSLSSLAFLQVGQAYYKELLILS